MNTHQKKLLVGFVVFSCSILLSITAILAFAVYQGRISTTGDIFDRLAAEAQFNWIAPTLVVLTGLLFTGILALAGLWRVCSDKKSA